VKFFLHLLKEKIDMRNLVLLVLAIIGIVRAYHPLKDKIYTSPYIDHWFYTLGLDDPNHEYYKDEQTLKLIQHGLTYGPQSMILPKDKHPSWIPQSVSIGDIIYGANISSDPAIQKLNTHTAGVAHRIFMRGQVKTLAEKYVAKFPDRMVVTYLLGVLDPAKDMANSPNDLVPVTFQLYSLIAGRLYHMNQLEPLNELSDAWAEKSGSVLSDDFQRMAWTEIQINGDILGTPFLHSTRSMTINTTTYGICGISLPPPFNDTRYPLPYSKTYTWVEFRDEAVALAQCGVKKPIIMEECMTVPWIQSLLHAFKIYILNADLKTCGLRNNKTINIIVDYLVPIFNATRITDTTQSMLKQWINFYSPIMQEYEFTPISQWPSKKPTPIPRSECNLATSIEGMSTHYGGLPKSELQLVVSPDAVNSLQSWFWSMKRSYGNHTVTPWQRQMGNDWIEMIINYTNVDGSPTPIKLLDLAAKSVPPYLSVRQQPEFYNIYAGVNATIRAKVTEMLNVKGRPLMYPRSLQKHTDQIEGFGAWSRFYHDAFLGKCPWDPWFDRDSAYKCVEWALSRFCDLIDFIFLPDCTLEKDSTFINIAGGWKIQVFDPTKANITCQESDESRIALASSPMLQQPINCIYPEHSHYELSACDEYSNMFATLVWNDDVVNRTCQITSVSLESLPERKTTVKLSCSYIAEKSIIANVIITISSISAILLVAIMLIVALRRKTTSIRASSWLWSEMLLAGCTTLVLIPLTEIGPRTDSTCSSYIIVSALALSVILGSLFVKLFRIALIFKSTILSIVRYGDGKLFQLFIIIVTINAVIIASWYFTALSNGFTQRKVLLDETVHGLHITECNYGSTVILIIWFVVIVCLLGLNMYLTRILRKTPEHFNEPQTLYHISMVLGLVCIPVVLISVLVSSDFTRSIFKAVIALLIGITVASVYISGKLYESFVDPKGIVSTRENNTQVSLMKNATDIKTPKHIISEHNGPSGIVVNAWQSK
jgi:hypothetical protein